jgi:hypothetical protein
MFNYFSFRLSAMAAQNSAVEISVIGDILTRGKRKRGVYEHLGYDVAKTSSNKKTGIL